MKLTNFIGNEKVVDSLSKLFEGGRFPHALIIEGEDGIGKKTLARDSELENRQPRQACNRL